MSIDRIPNMEQFDRLINAVNLLSAQELSFPRIIAREYKYNTNPIQINTSKEFFKDLIVADRTVIDTFKETEIGIHDAYLYKKYYNDTFYPESFGLGTVKTPVIFKYAIVPRSGNETSWSGADEQTIDQLLTESENGNINLATDYGWKVGDERIAFIRYHYDDKDYSYVDTLVRLILLDTNCFDLYKPTKGGRTKSEFVVGLKKYSDYQDWHYSDIKNDYSTVIKTLEKLLSTYNVINAVPGQLTYHIKNNYFRSVYSNSYIPDYYPSNTTGSEPRISPPEAYLPLYISKHLKQFICKQRSYGTINNVTTQMINTITPVITLPSVYEYTGVEQYGETENDFNQFEYYKTNTVEKLQVPSGGFSTRTVTEKNKCCVGIGKATSMGNVILTYSEDTRSRKLEPFFCI